MKIDIFDEKFQLLINNSKITMVRSACGADAPQAENCWNFNSVNAFSRPFFIIFTGGIPRDGIPTPLPTYATANGAARTEIL